MDEDLVYEPRKDPLCISSKKYTSRLLHCFGHKDTKLDPDTAAHIILSSGTDFITFNTHNINEIKRMEDLTLGFSDITLSQIQNLIPFSRYKLLNNINQAKTAGEAIARAEIASSISGSKSIKLEVLNPDQITSNDEEVINAAAILADKGYEVMPLISCNLATAKKIEALDCVMLRVMGSPICSFRGILTPQVMKKIFQEVNIPVVVDGGIGCPADAVEAMSLGADGVLVNAALFSTGNPILAAESMRFAVIAGRIWYLQNGDDSNGKSGVSDIST